MTEFDWAQDRGNKWVLQASRLEQMMHDIDQPVVSLLLDCTAKDENSQYRIADLACGNGGTSFELEKSVPAGWVLHGYDISQALVDSAVSRASKLRSRVQFKVADLQEEPEIEATYDLLVSLFGVMFFNDSSRAISNMRKWLSSEGRFVFAVWGCPSYNPWMSVVKNVVSNSVQLPITPEGAPGPFRYADTRILANELITAGFEEILVTDWRGKLPIGGGMNPRAAAEFALSTFSVGDVLAVTEPGVQQQALDELTSVYARYEENGIVMMNALVHLVSGTVRG